MKKVITLIFLATIIAIGSDSEAQGIDAEKASSESIKQFC